MEKKKVEITVRGQKFTILTDDAPERLVKLAADLNKTLADIMDGSRVTLTQGLVLTALDFADKADKYGAEAEDFRSRIADYLESAENAMTERDRLKRENEKLKERLTQAAARQTRG